MTFENIVEGLKVLAGLIVAVTTIIGALIGIFKWYKKRETSKIEKAKKEEAAEIRENRQDADIDRIKEENCLMMYGISACLDGLMQLNCNHSVPRAREKIDKYLNQMAHK